MPFTKVGTNRYRSPGGSTYTLKQVQLYYANGGAWPRSKKRKGKSRRRRKR